MQAILSQFSKTNKASTSDDDDIDKDIAMICRLQKEDDDEEVDQI
jgi:hypothetical protein